MKPPPPCLGDVLDSRAVVGIGLRTLLLSPGAVIIYANGATIEAFREFEMLWWVLLDDNLAGFREKKILLRVAGVTTILAPWRPQCPRTRPPLRPPGCQKCYGRSCWGSFHSLQKIGNAEGRGSSTGSTITMLTPWRPQWWPGSQKCPGRRLRFCWWTAPPGTL